MKAMLWVALLAIGFVVNAQNLETVSLSQAEAVREFPALGQAGYNFNKRFVERFNSLKTAGDSLLVRDDRPLVLAKQFGIELGIDPLVSLAASAAAPTPTPWKPHGTMLDPHPSEGTMLDSGNGVAKKYFVSGTVIQRTADGLLIECNRGGGAGYEQPKGDGWLVGKNAPEGEAIRTTAAKLGTYTYATVDGAERMVDEFQAQP